MLKFVKWLLLWYVTAAMAYSHNTTNCKFTVSTETSHNNQAFEYQLSLNHSNQQYEVYALTFPSPVNSPLPANNTVPGELYLPLNLTSTRDFPAVVCLHILNGNFELERMMCARLAQKGVIALFFKQPYYDERSGSAGRVRGIATAKIFAEGLDQGLADTRRAIDILLSMPSVNPQRIGITGISLGAIQSASACGFDNRIHKVFLTLGGGDLPLIVKSARETRRIREFLDKLPDAQQKALWQKIDAHDPLHAVGVLKRMAEQNCLRMVCASEDEVIPHAASLRLAKAIGFADQIHWLKGMGHYTAMAGFPAIVNDITDFFSADVPAKWELPPPGEVKTPYELAGTLFAGIAALTGMEPHADTAHLVGLDAQFNAGDKPVRLSFDLARGCHGKLSLTGNFPEVGRAGLGMGEYPWLLSNKGKMLFRGVLDSEKPPEFTNMLLPAHLLRFKVAIGALAGFALAPETLTQYYTLEELRTADNNREILIQINHKKIQGTIIMCFSAENIPLTLKWKFAKNQGEILFRYWQLNAAIDNSSFNGPDSMAQQDVPQEDLLRMFASVFEYVMEMLE